MVSNLVRTASISNECSTNCQMWFQRLVEEVDESEPTFEAVPIRRSSSSLLEKIPKAKPVGPALTPRGFKRVRLMRKVNNAKLRKELALKVMEAEREREQSRQKMEAALNGLGESQRGLEEVKDRVIEKYLSEQGEINSREAKGNRVQATPRGRSP